MNIFIPTIGTRMILNSPWTFTLHDERRNQKFWYDLFREETEAAKNWRNYYIGKCSPSRQVTLPVNTNLQVDRIYIRKGNKEFDSVSFRIVKPKTYKSPVPTGRFWVKLDEVNNGLNVAIVQDSDILP